MAWLDDRAWCHPKLTRLSDAAFRVWVAGICYSSGFSTQGELEPDHQRVIGVTRKVRSELVSLGLWVEDDAGSVLIHDWDAHNGKRDRRRAADRERKRRQRDRERDVTRDIPRDQPRDRRTLTGDRVTEELLPENGSSSSLPRTAARNPVWDALTEIFGEATTETARSRRGKVCRSLTRTGADHDEILRRARLWPRHFEGATLTETALEKHWDALGRPPLRAGA